MSTEEEIDPVREARRAQVMEDAAADVESTSEVSAAVDRRIRNAVVATVAHRELGRPAEDADEKAEALAKAEREYPEVFGQ